MADESKHPVCAVVGVGPGNGAAIARRFAADGYAIALMARSAELTTKLAAELPRDPSGKLLKRRLRDPYWAAQATKI